MIIIWLTSIFLLFLKCSTELPCIVVTPAGRREYLQILLKYLIREKDDFQEWQLWQNTIKKQDIQYLAKLPNQYSWIKLKKYPFKNPWKKPDGGINKFWSFELNPKAVYIRLDDDIVWLQKGFIKKFYKQRIQNPEYFIISANVINNGILNYIHQKYKKLDYKEKIDYDAVGNSWNDPKIGISIHEQFINDVKNNKIQEWKTFKTWKLIERQRISINAISYFGKDIHDFGGVPNGIDQQKYVTVTLTKKYYSYNLVVGEPICSHYAFYTQRPIYESATNLRQKYKQISQKI